MRRLFALLAALGLFAAGCTHMHGVCDCDKTWGCGCCPPYGHPDDHAAPVTAPPAGPATAAPVTAPAPLPPSK